MNIIFIPGNKPIYIPVFSHIEHDTQKEELKLIEQYFVQTTKQLRKIIKNQYRFEEDSQ